MADDFAANSVPGVRPDDLSRGNMLPAIQNVGTAKSIFRLPDSDDNDCIQPYAIEYQDGGDDDHDDNSTKHDNNTCIQPYAIGYQEKEDNYAEKSSTFQTSPTDGEVQPYAVAYLHENVALGLGEAKTDESFQRSEAATTSSNAISVNTAGQDSSEDDTDALAGIQPYAVKYHEKDDEDNNKRTKRNGNPCIQPYAVRYQTQDDKDNGKHTEHKCSAVLVEHTREISPTDVDIQPYAVKYMCQDYVAYMASSSEETQTKESTNKIKNVADCSKGSSNDDTDTSVFVGDNRNLRQVRHPLKTLHPSPTCAQNVLNPNPTNAMIPNPMYAQIRDQRNAQGALIPNQMHVANVRPQRADVSPPAVVEPEESPPQPADVASRPPDPLYVRRAGQRFWCTKRILDWQRQALRAREDPDAALKPVREYGEDSAVLQNAENVEIGLEGHYENDKELGHYENDKELGHYENDKEQRHYENDKEHRKYENDKERHYENDKQKVQRHYENDKEHRHYENDKEQRHYENDEEHSNLSTHVYADLDPDFLAAQDAIQNVTAQPFYEMDVAPADEEQEQPFYKMDVTAAKDTEKQEQPFYEMKAASTDENEQVRNTKVTETLAVEDRTVETLAATNQEKMEKKPPLLQTESLENTGASIQAGSTPEDELERLYESRKTTGCPTGYIAHNGAFYKVYNQSKTYDQAREQCAADGGLLAMPKNKQLDAFLFRLKNVLGGPGYGYFWFGLSYEHREGEWKWADGTPHNITADWGNWVPNQPEGCAHYFGWMEGWDSMWCDFSNKFICQLTHGYKKWRDDGRCGPEFPLEDGSPAECDPGGVYPCCSPEKWCGKTTWHCDCQDCVDYSKKSAT
ncbi:hypothetical protein Bbelb_278480, partial [Branchiostoma belcheri]